MNKNIIVAVAIVLVAILGGFYYFMTSEPIDTAGPVDIETRPSVSYDQYGNVVPRIDIVAPSKARIGDTIEIRGTAFSGFEGDKYAWIENSAGEGGIIYGDFSVATNEYIRFVLEDKYCTHNTTYSGLDCPSYISITPGKYKIYAYPWGEKSNKVDFEVIK